VILSQEKAERCTGEKPLLVCGGLPPLLPRQRGDILPGGYNCNDLQVEKSESKLSHPKSAEDVFYFVEEGGTALGRLVFYFQRGAELLD